MADSNQLSRRRLLALAVGVATLLAGLLAGRATAADGNRLAHVDQPIDPFWVGLETPRLTTPQWVGDDGVEAVIVPSVDDLRDVARFDRYLRPLLDRLKQIDGRAPVSIICNSVDPRDPHLQVWLREGLSIETHTVDHPCPCLQQGGVARAKYTYDACIELLAQVPNMRPLLFRVPCFDSMNATSPRFFTELFNRTTPSGKFLMLSSSVATVPTAADPTLPRQVVFDSQRRARFAKYLPTDRSYAGYVEDYPYPYVIGRLCWEIPAITPDDWQGQHLHGSASPETLDDLHAAIDAAVIKQGAVALVFHTGGWIRNTQLVELIDRTDRQHGHKVKYLNFAEVYQRLLKNLLGDQPLRAANGQDNGVRVLDLNADGLMDVVIGNENVRQTRLWLPNQRRWVTGDFPMPLVEVDDDGNRRDAGARFGVLQENGFASMLVRNQTGVAGLWHFDGKQWVADPRGLVGLEAGGPVFTVHNGTDQGARFRDVDNDGRCELVVRNARQNAVFGWFAENRRWQRLTYGLPGGTTIVDEQGRDAGLRLVDIDEDGHLDIVFSNAVRYAMHLFTPGKGWNRTVLSGRQGDAQPNAIPPIVRADGTNNGAWFKYRHMWVQNEETGATEPHHVISRRFTDLLVDELEPPPRGGG